MLALGSGVRFKRVRCVFDRKSSALSELNDLSRRCQNAVSLVKSLKGEIRNETIFDGGCANSIINFFC